MPLPHPCWLVLFLTWREVGSLCHPVGPASLDDWRYSCLCSELIPSVIEKSTLFVKELSFPQTTPTDDAFFNRIGLERIGSRWAGLGQLLGWFIGSVTALPYRKGQKRKKGQQGLLPWPLRCLSQFLPERKDRLLRG